MFLSFIYHFKWKAIVNKNWGFEQYHMTYLYTYLHIFKGPKKIIGIAGKLLKTMQMLLIITWKKLKIKLLLIVKL